MKFRLLALILIGIGVLGLRDPENPKRDPVPGDLIVAPSIHCEGCHGFDPTGVAMHDEAGNDVNIFDDWQVSMMALSARDPFWRATLQHEVSLYPAAQEEIEQTCLKCHAPLGSQQRTFDGLGYSYQEMLGDSLGLDGVSCAACHQQTPESYGRSHSGNITLNTERLIYGPHPEPLEGPMDLYVGFRPVYTDLIYSSGVCAGCHTLITGTLDETGTPTGNHFVEQATYHEWVNSSYAFQGIECQNCHLPVIQDSVILAIDLKDLQKRSPFGVHQFQGANTAMLTLMGENQEALELPAVSSEAWGQSISGNRESLRSAAEIRIAAYRAEADTLYLNVAVMNKAGHKLPSGYPSRVAWLQVILRSDISGDTIYANGLLNPDGNISGRDQPYEQHHTISRSAADVQIYEMVMADSDGNITTRLNAAHVSQKDNRLLPKGFRTNHAVYDTVAIRGAALDDPDYGAFSTLGMDQIEYRIPLNGVDGLADLHVALRYHTFPMRWMRDLFENDGIPAVGAFKNMYTGYETFTELIDSVGVEDIVLEPSTVNDLYNDQIRVFPNPVVGRRIYINADRAFPDTYILFDMDGKIVSSGSVNGVIVLNSDILAGAYILSLSRGGTLSAVKKLMIW